MKNMRVKVAAAVFAGILLLTLFSVVTVRRSCMHMIEKTAAVRTAAAQEDDAAARAAIISLQETWRHESNILRFFVPCETLSSLNQAVFRIDPLYISECNELNAELDSVQAALQWLYGMELTVF